MDSEHVHPDVTIEKLVDNVNGHCTNEKNSCVSSLHDEAKISNKKCSNEGKISVIKNDSNNQENIYTPTEPNVICETNNAIDSSVENQQARYESICNEQVQPRSRDEKEPDSINYHSKEIMGDLVEANVENEVHLCTADETEETQSSIEQVAEEYINDKENDMTNLLKRTLLEYNSSDRKILTKEKPGKVIPALSNIKAPDNNDCESNSVISVTEGSNSTVIYIENIEASKVDNLEKKMDDIMEKQDGLVESDIGFQKSVCEILENEERLTNCSSNESRKPDYVLDANEVMQTGECSLTRNTVETMSDTETQDDQNSVIHCIHEQGYKSEVVPPNVCSTKLNSSQDKCTEVLCTETENDTNCKRITNNYINIIPDNNYDHSPVASEAYYEKVHHDQTNTYCSIPTDVRDQFKPSSNILYSNNTSCKIEGASALLPGNESYTHLSDNQTCNDIVVKTEPFDAGHCVINIEPVDYISQQTSSSVSTSCVTYTSPPSRKLTSTPASLSSVHFPSFNDPQSSIWDFSIVDVNDHVNRVYCVAEHSTDSSSKLKSYGCNFCNFTSEKFEIMKSHEKIHQFSCDKCDFMSRMRSVLHEHQLQKHYERKCDLVLYSHKMPYKSAIVKYDNRYQFGNLYGKKIDKSKMPINKVLPTTPMTNTQTLILKTNGAKTTDANMFILHKQGNVKTNHIQVNSLKSSRSSIPVASVQTASKEPGKRCPKEVYVRGGNHEHVPKEVQLPSVLAAKTTSVYHQKGDIIPVTKLNDGMFQERFSVPDQEKTIVIKQRKPDFVRGLSSVKGGILYTAPKSQLIEKKPTPKKCAPKPALYPTYFVSSPSPVKTSEVLNITSNSLLTDSEKTLTPEKYTGSPAPSLASPFYESIKIKLRKGKQSNVLWECFYCVYQSLVQSKVISHILEEHKTSKIKLKRVVKNKIKEGHLTNKDDRGLWTCYYCQVTDTSRETVINHVKKHHPNVKIMITRKADNNDEKQNKDEFIEWLVDILKQCIPGIKWIWKKCLVFELSMKIPVYVSSTRVQENVYKEWAKSIGLFNEDGEKAHHDYPAWKECLLKALEEAQRGGSSYLCHVGTLKEADSHEILQYYRFKFNSKEEFEKWFPEMDFSDLSKFESLIPWLHEKLHGKKRVQNLEWIDREKGVFKLPCKTGDKGNMRDLCSKWFESVDKLECPIGGPHYYHIVEIILLHAINDAMVKGKLVLYGNRKKSESENFLKFSFAEGHNVKPGISTSAHAQVKGDDEETLSVPSPGHNVKPGISTSAHAQVKGDDEETLSVPSPGHNVKPGISTSAHAQVIGDDEETLSVPSPGHNVKPGISTSAHAQVIGDDEETLSVPSPDNLQPISCNDLTLQIESSRSLSALQVATLPGTSDNMDNMLTSFDGITMEKMECGDELSQANALWTGDGYGFMEKPKSKRGRKRPHNVNDPWGYSPTPCKQKMIFKKSKNRSLFQHKKYYNVGLQHVKTMAPQQFSGIMTTKHLGQVFKVLTLKELPDDLKVDIRKYYSYNFESKRGHCLYCNYTTRENSSQGHSHLREHVMTHTGGKLWACIHCDYKSNRKGNICLHTLMKHPDKEKRVIRRKPFTGYKRKIPITKYTQKHQEVYEYPAPSVRFVRKLQGPRSVRTKQILKESKQFWQCPYCSRRSTFKASILHHVKFVHPANDQSAELQCWTKPNWSLDLLKTRQLKQSVVKLFALKDMPKFKVLKEVLDSNGDNLYKDLDQDDIYLGDNTGVTISTVSGLTCRSSKQENRHKYKKRIICHFCKYTTKFGSLYFRHILNTHPNHFNDEAVQNFVFQCSSCTYFTNNLDEIRAHIILEHPSESDKLDNMNYLSSRDTKEPFVVEYSNFNEQSINASSSNNSGNTYGCFHCDYKTFDLQNVKIHLKEVHPKNSILKVVQWSPDGSQSFSDLCESPSCLFIACNRKSLSVHYLEFPDHFISAGGNGFPVCLDEQITMSNVTQENVPNSQSSSDKSFQDHYVLHHLDNKKYNFTKDVSLMRAQCSTLGLPVLYKCRYCSFPVNESLAVLKNHLLEFHNDSPPVVINMKARLQKQKSVLILCLEQNCSWYQKDLHLYHDHMELVHPGVPYHHIKVYHKGWKWSNKTLSSPDCPHSTQESYGNSCKIPFALQLSDPDQINRHRCKGKQTKKRTGRRKKNIDNSDDEEDLDYTPNRSYKPKQVKLLPVLKCGNNEKIESCSNTPVNFEVFGHPVELPHIDEVTSVQSGFPKFPCEKSFKSYIIPGFENRFKCSLCMSKFQTLTEAKVHTIYNHYDEVSLPKYIIISDLYSKSLRKKIKIYICVNMQCVFICKMYELIIMHTTCSRNKFELYNQDLLESLQLSNTPFQINKTDTVSNRKEPGSRPFHNVDSSQADGESCNGISNNGEPEDSQSSFEKSLQESSNINTKNYASNDGALKEIEELNADKTIQLPIDKTDENEIDTTFEEDCRLDKSVIDGDGYMMYQCDYCIFQTSNDKSMKTHLETNHQTTQNRYTLVVIQNERKEKTNAISNESDPVKVNVHVQPDTLYLSSEDMKYIPECNREETEIIFTGTSEDLNDTGEGNREEREIISTKT